MIFKSNKVEAIHFSPYLMEKGLYFKYNLDIIYGYEIKK